MNTKQFIGRRVKVIVDRPLGSTDPECGYIYPINCGRVPDESANADSKLDAFILGLCEPINTFEGDCIAIIEKQGEHIGQLIIVPSGAALSDEAIRESFRFHDSFVDSRIIR